MQVLKSCQYLEEKHEKYKLYIAFMYWKGRRKQGSAFDYLANEELGASLRQPTVRAVENHLKHVPVHLLHDDVDLCQR